MVAYNQVQRLLVIGCRGLVLNFGPNPNLPNWDLHGSAGPHRFTVRLVAATASGRDITAQATTRARARASGCSVVQVCFRTH